VSHSHTVIASVACPLLCVAGSLVLDVSILVCYLDSSLYGGPFFSFPPVCMVFSNVIVSVDWLNQESFRRFIDANTGPCFVGRELTCYLKYSYVLCPVYEIRSGLQQYFVSNSCMHLSVSTFRVSSPIWRGRWIQRVLCSDYAWFDD